MPVFLNATDPNFEAEFQTLLSAKREDSPDVDQVVADIIADVRARGDAALLEYTERFDRLTLAPETFGYQAQKSRQKSKGCAEDRAALELAAAHSCLSRGTNAPRCMVERCKWRGTGMALDTCQRRRLDVPGGLATYPSSVLMNAIPAKVAGVERLAITVPTPDGAINPLVILAADGRR